MSQDHQTLYSVFFDSNGSRYDWNNSLVDQLKNGLTTRHWVDKDFLYYFFKAALLNNNIGSDEYDQNEDKACANSTQDEFGIIIYNQDVIKLAIEKIRDIKPDEITISLTRLTAYLYQLSFQTFFLQTISSCNNGERVDLYRKQRHAWSVYEQSYEYDPLKHAPITYGLYLTPDTSLIKVYLYHPYLELKMNLSHGSSAFLGLKRTALNAVTSKSSCTPHDYIFLGSLFNQALLAQDLSILSTKCIANFMDQAIQNLN